VPIRPLYNTLNYSRWKVVGSYCSCISTVLKFPCHCHPDCTSCAAAASCCSKPCVTPAPAAALLLYAAAIFLCPALPDVPCCAFTVLLCVVQVVWVSSSTLWCLT
jgi:hypothetical protein